MTLNSQRHCHHTFSGRFRPARQRHNPHQVQLARKKKILADENASSTHFPCHQKQDIIDHQRLDGIARNSNSLISADGLSIVGFPALTMTPTRTSYPCLTTVHLSFRPIIRAEATDQLLFTLVAIVVINLIRCPATEQGEKRAKRAANSCKPGFQHTSLLLSNFREILIHQ